jgi:hypothetical protein
MANNLPSILKCFGPLRKEVLKFNDGFYIEQETGKRWPEGKQVLVGGLDIRMRRWENRRPVDIFMSEGGKSFEDLLAEAKDEAEEKAKKPLRDYEAMLNARIPENQWPFDTKGNVTPPNKFKGRRHPQRRRRIGITGRSGRRHRSRHDLRATRPSLFDRRLLRYRKPCHRLGRP